MASRSIIRCLPVFLSIYRSDTPWKAAFGELGQTQYRIWTIQEEDQFIPCSKECSPSKSCRPLVLCNLGTKLCLKVSCVLFYPYPTYVDMVCSNKPSVLLQTRYPLHQHNIHTTRFHCKAVYPSMHSTNYCLGDIQNQFCVYRDYESN
jgi:hypothetical protein